MYVERLTGFTLIQNGNNMNDFQTELESLINRYSLENNSNTPDFILASYINACLAAFNEAVNQRSDWYDRHDSPGESLKTISVLTKPIQPDYLEPAGNYNAFYS